MKQNTTQANSLVSLLSSIREDENIPKPLRPYATRYALEEYLNTPTIGLTKEELCQKTQDIYENTLTQIYKIMKIK